MLYNKWKEVLETFIHNPQGFELYVKLNCKDKFKIQKFFTKYFFPVYTLKKRRTNDRERIRTNFGIELEYGGTNCDFIKSKFHKKLINVNNGYDNDTTTRLRELRLRGAGYKHLLIINEVLNVIKEVKVYLPVNASIHIHYDLRKIENYQSNVNSSILLRKLKEYFNCTPLNKYITNVTINSLDTIEFRSCTPTLDWNIFVKEFLIVFLTITTFLRIEQVEQTTKVDETIEKLQNELSEISEFIQQC